MSLKAVLNFFWMSSTCLLKETVADLALSIACGTSEVVLMFTSRDWAMSVGLHLCRIGSGGLTLGLHVGLFLGGHDLNLCTLADGQG